MADLRVHREGADVRRLLTVLACVVALVAASCGGGGGDGGGILGVGKGKSGKESKEGSVGEASRSAEEEAAEAEAAPVTYQEAIELTVEDVETFWSAQLPDVYGIGYEEIAEVIPYDSTTDFTDLGECFEGAAYEDVAENAFYCSLDDVVAYDDETLFPRFYEEFGAFAIALALAHEWGHAIQARVAYEAPTVLSETQADCFAGAWASHVDAGRSDLLSLDPGDLEIGLTGLLEVRDPIGTDPTEEGAHGSGFDRVGAFQEGFNSGVERCKDWDVNPPLITEIPFTDEVDLANEGNLPLDGPGGDPEDAFDLAVDDLDAYWSQFEELSPYETVSDVIPYDSSDRDSLPPCESLDLKPRNRDAYADSVFYCADDDFIAYEESLFETVHEDIGDGAIMFLLSNAWASAMQARLGIEGEGLGLQADCFSGSYTGSIPIDEVTAANGTAVGRESAIQLSPGDLDEVVQGFLLFGDPPDAEETSRGTAFDRLDAFRNGFLNAEAVCLEMVG
jgi:predicted metalloprotease